MPGKMSKDATVAASSTVTGAPGEPDARSGHTRAALAVLALATGFALIPRLTHGCEGASLEEDAPPFEGRLVANADALVLGTTDAGKPAPGRVDLASLRGHPVVLDFWATWCGPCQAESPIVNTIARRYEDRGLAVVGVNTSDEDGLAAAYVLKKGLRFPMVYDEGNAIAKKYGVTSLPTLVVISKQGKIVAVRNGVTSDGALDEIIRRYL
jgi:thiol-disulfide isomerase/thioredoxin